MNKRIKLIAGNWKMNTTISSSEELVNGILHKIENNNYKSEILICPPFTNLYHINKLIENKNISLGAQNCDYHDSGAFTGEISLEMLKSVGCSYVIIGHSERRTIFLESEMQINKKIKKSLEVGITPIFCIGESLEQRQSGKTYKVLEQQIKRGFEGIENENFNRIVIAYEPVWAIGTGIAATSQEAQEAHAFIRSYINQNYSSTADEIRILYGGSMNEKNCKELLSLPDIDGGLIGGASLNAETFVKILTASEESL